MSMQQCLIDLVCWSVMVTGNTSCWSHSPNVLLQVQPQQEGPVMMPHQSTAKTQVGPVSGNLA